MKKELNVPYGIVYGKPDIFYKIDIMGTCIYKALVALVVKNPPGNAGDLRDLSLIPGSGRSPEKKMATHSCILGWEIQWTEESGGLQSMGLQELDTTEGLSNNSKINYYHIR